MTPFERAFYVNFPPNQRLRQRSRCRISVKTLTKRKV